MTQFDNASRKSQSMARLIAEEAFSRPTPPAATNIPIVRIVGRKLSLSAAAASPPRPLPAQPVAEGPGESAKKPRVFVIRPNGVAAPGQTEVESGIAIPHRSRRRANAPAPVQVIYSAPEHPAPQPAPSLEFLACSLAGLEPTLEIIRHAMAFDFIDPAIVAEWDQLSRAAGQLSELIAS